MLQEKLNGYRLILASGSPRRQQFFKDLGVDVEIRLKPVVEDYPEHLVHREISDHIAQLKAIPFQGTLNANEILITSDTIVWHQNKALGKPIDDQDAFAMLTSLSGKTHQVITSVCFTTHTSQKIENAVTQVSFKHLTEEEIRYYIHTYQPLDKAGAYGIQEWIGHIGITEIKGSYVNVMGLPLHLVYKTLTTMVSS